MNDIQRTQIINMRVEGVGYRTIAKTLNISENTIKSFCRRNKLTGTCKVVSLKPLEPLQVEVRCKCCDKIVPQNDKRKKKLFCSDKCRMTWWNSHRELVKHKNQVTKVCPYCHKEFISYEKAERKYCSHECYIADRFGGGRHE